MNNNKFVGSTILAVDGMEEGSDMIVVKTDRGVFRMWHEQDCCESVYVEDVIGDVNDLIGGVVASFSEDDDGGNTDFGSETWTFYQIRTTNGDVTIRWYGSSNGDYSESVSCCWTPTAAMNQPVDDEDSVEESAADDETWPPSVNWSPVDL